MFIIPRFRLLGCLLVALTGAIFFTTPPAQAQYSRDGDNDRYSSSMSLAIDRLDEDEVETFNLPVLFGLSLSSVRSDFGDPRGDGTRSHEGQDFIAPLGTPIVSPTEAVVTRIGTGESAGKYVYTANPGGESWRYMHLDDFADIDEGDVLEEGDYIGTVGDTGNAKGGVAHLHFEVRKGEALDPYPRLDEAYGLKEKMEFVARMFEDLDDEEAMAEFLVSTYLNEFKTALNSGYDLPKEITDALKDRGIVDKSELQQKLLEIIAIIPTVVAAPLEAGDSGVEVSLIQLFLVFEKTGSAATALSQAGATGYFGPVTEAAVREYQAVNKLPTTGLYDDATRNEMMDN